MIQGKPAARACAPVREGPGARRPDGACAIRHAGRRGAPDGRQGRSRAGSGPSRTGPATAAGSRDDPSASRAGVRIPPFITRQRHGTNDRWPLQDFLELGALVSAVPCARLHARQVLWEWGIGNLGDSAGLLVSELITNAVRASCEAGRVSAVRLWLLSDSAQILILVWDASPRPPVLTDAGGEAEHGRGLMLVDAVSEQWGWCSGEVGDGKFVWAITRLRIPGGSHPAEIIAGITQSLQAALPRCLAHGPEAGRPGREAGKRCQCRRGSRVRGPGIRARHPEGHSVRELRSGGPRRGPRTGG